MVTESKGTNEGCSRHMLGWPASPTAAGCHDLVPQQTWPSASLLSQWPLQLSLSPHSMNSQHPDYRWSRGGQHSCLIQSVDAQWHGPAHRWRIGTHGHSSAPTQDRGSWSDVQAMWLPSVAAGAPTRQEKVKKKEEVWDIHRKIQGSEKKQEGGYLA